MEDIPTLIIKAKNNTIFIIAKYMDEYAEHEIQLKSVLGYYWKNELPAIEKFLELLETVIKRSIERVFQHKKLFIKYNIRSNDDLEDSSRLEITFIEVKADNTKLKLVGEVIALEGIDLRGTFSKVTSFRRKVDETIQKEIASFGYEF